MADDKKATKKSKASPLNEAVLRLVEGMKPKAANLIIEAYNEVPYIVRDALDEYYTAKGRISDKEGIDSVRKSLEALKKACEANPDYMQLYDAAQDDANQEIAELYANGGISV